MTAEDGPAPATPTRGEQTRARIVSTALRLFRERGYDATTMRAVASEADVSLGNAYYYFASKEHLVQAFYDATQTDHLLASQPVLRGEGDFAVRLLGVLRARIETMVDYHEFAATFFKNAADPASPLSPFSPESRPAREVSTGIYREVVEGSDVRCATELRPLLPEVLWLYQMGIVLFWVYDRTPETRATYHLIERTVPLVARLIELSRLRVLRSTVSDVISLFTELGFLASAPVPPGPTHPEGLS